MAVRCEVKAGRGTNREGMTMERGAELQDKRNSRQRVRKISVAAKRGQYVITVDGAATLDKLDLLEFAEKLTDLINEKVNLEDY